MKKTVSSETIQTSPRGYGHTSPRRSSILSPAYRSGRPESGSLHRVVLTLVLLLSMLSVFVPSALADLTVTLQENADGSATLSLSGTSAVTGNLTGATATNFSPESGVPPITGPGYTLFLSEGLSLTFDGIADPLPVLAITTAGNSWRLVFSSAELISVTGVTGLGSLRLEDFPFFLFEAGTFRVDALPVLSEVEASEVRGAVTAVGVYPFATVYNVIPFDRNVSISGKSPGILGSGAGGKSTGLIRITNNGNVALENISLDEASSDFKLGKPLRTSLAPGESTTCKVTFTSRKPSARTKVSITAFTPTRIFEAPTVESAEEVSEVGEGYLEPSSLLIPGDPVGAFVTVRGKNAGKVTRNRAPRNPIRLLQSKTSGR